MAAWGMIIEPKKNYKQNVKRSYKITQAVLNRETAGKSFTDLLLTIGDKSFIACTLNASNPQCALNLRFPKGDKIAFSTRGEGAIHLTGYTLEDAVVASANGHGDSAASAKSAKSDGKHKDLKKLLEKTMSDSDSDDMDYSQMMEDYDGLEEESGDDSDAEEAGEDDEDDSDAGSDDQDEDGESMSDDAEDDDDDAEEDDESGEEEVKPPPAKKEKKDKQQPPQQAKKQEKKEQPQVNGTAKGDGKVVALSGGVKIKDLKEGNGAFAKPGKTVVVYYEGRLQGNNKLFDSCKQGTGFSFRLGDGMVIKGWDTGVAGMRVGGKRQIICPPNMAYGQRGSPPVIPPNSTLVFEVQLKNVK